MALPKTETFTNSNGTPLSTHDANWALVSGGQTITNNNMSPAGGTGTTENCHRWTGDTFAATHYAKATYANQSGAFVGVAVNIQSGAANYYAFYGRTLSYNNRRELVEVSAGAVATTHGADTTNLSAGQEIYLEKGASDAIVAKVNGATIFSVTDSTWTGGAAGVASRGSSQYSRIDDAELGDVGGGGSTGTLATTNANDTSAASGTPTANGSLARTNAADTSSAAGTTTVTGSSATTNAADTSMASGVVGSVSGSLATTNAADTSAAAGTTTVLGASATTNTADTLAAAGTTTVTGTLAATNGNDTLSASGIVGSPSGTLATTNASDTLSAAGSTTVTGALAYTSNADTSAAQGETGLQQGGGGGRKKKFKSWDQRERERLEQLRKDEEWRNKDKYGDMPKGLEDALKAAPSPYKRLSPQAVKAYQAARLKDDEDAFALIAGLL